MLQEHLWDLGGFAGAGGRGQDQAPVGFQPGDEVALDLVNGQTVGHQDAEDNRLPSAGKTKPPFEAAAQRTVVAHVETVGKMSEGLYQPRTVRKNRTKPAVFLSPLPGLFDD